MNRALRRLLGLTKKKHTDWTCPNCEMFYTEIYDQATEMPYIYCHRSCLHFFDHQGDDVTNLIYPNGTPWEQGSNNHGTK